MSTILDLVLTKASRIDNDDLERSILTNFFFLPFCVK